MKDEVITMMNHRRLVVSDARYLEQEADQAAGLFFHYLQSLSPKACDLFDNDSQRMAAAFRAMLRVFSSLKFMDDKAYEYERLAQRHRHYGVDQGMIKAANQALILTLRKVLGEDFSHKHLVAWKITLDYFSGLFKSRLPTAADREKPVALKAG